MIRRLLVLIALFLLVTSSYAQRKKAGQTDPIGSFVQNFIHYPGFIDFYWDEQKDQIYLLVKDFDKEMIYINSLAAGVGSNDIGLDRGQLGQTRIVRFDRHGPKIFLTQPNYMYRAVSENDAEINAVKDAFAESVLWGFKVEKESSEGVLVNATDFFLRDAHGVTARLARAKQGTYSLDNSRSAIYAEGTMNFPDNSEFESILTFKGKPEGSYIQSVTPTASSVTVRQHHSFVKLPDDGYTPREHDPRAGFFGITYFDYATPIDQSLIKRYISRHRLKKKDPSAARSQAVEPIVYYLDPGTPEPVRSALLDGARWWNQAFEAAGYIDAFRVEMLPEDAHPLDVRYNVIQWIHRSTRGWSYGSSVRDPRTGEIIKGHVSLGSLRVRQDFLIAEGLLSPYTSEEIPDDMIEMALARIRQLSAHEVGHTLGLAHNYSASASNRASVMDYPHPYVKLTDGQIDLSEAYDDKIGEWDKIAISYGYSDFGTEDKTRLNDILLKAHDQGILFISDRDARAQGGAHPEAHLWDNGADASDELNRVMDVRKAALDNFSLSNIREGEPYSNLEDRLVPIYLFHRYQLEAAVKLIGGEKYTYGIKGQPEFVNQILAKPDQQKALDAVLATLSPDQLTLSNDIADLIPPAAFGYSRSRESFEHRTGLTFDAISVAETAGSLTLQLLLNPQRVSRLVEQHAINNGNLGLDEVFSQLLKSTWKSSAGNGLAAEVKRTTDILALEYLFKLYASDQTSPSAKRIIYSHIKDLQKWLNTNTSSDNDHYQFGIYRISQFLEDPDEFNVPEALSTPDGSPIGENYCGGNGLEFAKSQ